MKRFKNVFITLSCLLLVVMTGFVFTGCDLFSVTEGEIIEKTFDQTGKGDFTKISLNVDGGINLDISYGDEYKITYTESDIEKFNIKIENQTLIVGQTRTKKSIKNYKAKWLSIVVPNTIAIQNVIADVDGALTGLLIGDYKNVSFDVDGAANINISGNVEAFSLDTDGTTTLAGKDLVCSTATIECSGMLTFEITCNDVLFIDCDGMCNGTYYGPATLDKHINGMCNIRKGE